MLMSKSTLKPIVVALCLSVGIAPVYANEATSLLKNSSTDFNLRYRLESVDQSGVDESALASTLKARVTWSSGDISGFIINAELDHVMALGVDDYNDASGLSSKTNYPVIADPTGTDLNQLNVRYTKDKLSVIAGRQRIVLGDQRFVGGVAWRQNEQTYDGVRVKFGVNERLSLDYSYITDVQRIFGPDGPKKSLSGGFQLFNADYKINAEHKITGLAYLIDTDGSNDPLNTFGLDYQGQFADIGLHANVSNQTVGDYSASYIALDVSKKVNGIKVTFGLEQLGSDDGQYGFSTPFATAHKFQGFADKFLGTPATGVSDYYIKLGSVVNGVKLAAFYHTFHAVEGSASYGSEIDLVASYNIHKTTSLVAKFASYSADDLATDTNKFWFMTNSKF